MTQHPGGQSTLAATGGLCPPDPSPGRPALWRLCLAGVLCVLLSGCALNPLNLLDVFDGTTRSGGVSGSRSYTVRGKTYYPLKSAKGFREEGLASWYGKPFHGRTTANGETFNMNSMTAAHKILPFNTTVRVTDIRTGRNVLVRINDRGPFVSGRVIDLSRRAAEILGTANRGVSRVRVEAIDTR